MYAKFSQFTFDAQMRGISNKHLVFTIIILLGVFSKSHASSPIISSQATKVQCLVSEVIAPIAKHVIVEAHQTKDSRVFAEVTDSEEKVEEEETAASATSLLFSISSALIYARLCLTLIADVRRKFVWNRLHLSFFDTTDLHQRFEVYRI